MAVPIAATAAESLSPARAAEVGADHLVEQRDAGQIGGRPVGEHRAGDRIRDLERLEVLGLERPDDHAVAIGAPPEQELLAADPVAVEDAGARLGVARAEAARPGDVAVVRAHGVDDAGAARELVDDERLLAADADGLGHLEVQEDDAAEGEQDGHQ
ncbi:MAG: hypothetical protein U0835_00125 [Isosphaeraceae bacterium]